MASAAAAADAATSVAAAASANATDAGSPSAAAAPAAESAAAASTDVEPKGKVHLNEAIKALKAQQAAAKAERLRITRELRNACRRKRRLQKRARQLTDNDLLEVLQMRAGAAMAVDGESTTAESTSASANGTEATGDIAMD